MKILLTTKTFIIVLLTVIFASCETSEVTKMSFDKTTISINLGQQDTLTAKITYTGDISAIPLEIVNSDLTVVEVKELNSSAMSEGGSTMVERTYTLKSLKAGTATLTLKAGKMELKCQVTIEQKKLVFQKATANNYGDYYDTESNNFELLLMENGLSFNTEGKIQGTGYMLYMDMFGALTQNTFGDGEYFPAEDGRAISYLKGELFENEDGEEDSFGSRIYKFTTKETEEYMISEGSLKVLTVGGITRITADFITLDGELINVSFEGMIDNQDKRDEPEDLKPALNAGLLYYLSDTYKSNAVNTYIAYLGNEIEYRSDSIIIKGDNIFIELNTALTAKDSIPSGTYNVIKSNQFSDPLVITDLIPGSIVPGYTSTSGSNWGTWFYGEQTKQIKSGNMRVKRDGKKYQFQYEFFDRFGTRVSGVYNDTLRYIDGTKSSSGIKGMKLIRKDNKTRELKEVMTKKMPLSWKKD
jgi:hypothetical protein